MFIKKWKSVFSSMFYFLKLIFSSKKYDVVFVSSAFFNRGKDGENLLLKPMVECCKKNNLSYMVFEDTDIKGAYDNFSRDKNSIPFDLITFFQIILRKIFYLKNNKPISKDQIYLQELKISKILKNLFFKKFHSKVYITLLWNNVTLWRSINPSACIVDYQHGIVFDGHEESVKNGQPPKVKLANDVVTLVYGKIFKNILIDNDKTGFYNQKNVINIGLNKDSYVLKEKPVNNKKILFTLQIVPDFKEKEVNQHYIDIVEQLIDINADYLSKNDYEIIFRHHPRYSSNHCPSININHDFVSFDSETPIADLLNTVSIHMTFHSTSTLEAAMKGIPSILIDMHEQFSPNEVFLKQYKYPFNNLVVRAYEGLQNALMELDRTNIFDNKCNDIFKWSEKLYQDFDELLFRDFLLDQLNETKNDIGKGGN